MQDTRYLARREQIETYFDRTAARAWEQLTSNAPLGRIRATVREGRDQMRNTLLSWLPPDLRGARILDAGCGTGAFAAEASARGAHVLAIDLSPTLVNLARERHAGRRHAHGGTIDFRSGDMLAPALGAFDYVVAMDSLIHYDASQIVHALDALSGRTSEAMLFTFAPRTPLLAVMHSVGRLFPRSDRSPALEPVAQNRLREGLVQGLGPRGWSAGRERRVACGFYTSHAWEWKK